MSGGRAGVVVAHLAAIAAFLGLWELAMQREWLSQAFFGQPSNVPPAGVHFLVTAS